MWFGNTYHIFKNREHFGENILTTLKSRNYYAVLTDVDEIVHQCKRLYAKRKNTGSHK